MKQQSATGHEEEERKRVKRRGKKTSKGKGLKMWREEKFQLTKREERSRNLFKKLLF